ncbi:BLUF domain-containing protein [Polaromonas sp. YR568]|uniref:BLUF domain-containing protein n=1 Tax=Polaromonas sp. YR568 TaxID=1855301 RepID=UPI0031376E16
MSATHHERIDEPIAGHNLPLLYNMVYCSRAAPGVNAEAVDRIIASSRRHNPARGITGQLAFGSGIFFQWLEGPRASVLQLMETLQTDPRHESIVLLSSDEERRERMFPGWDMELVTEMDIREVLMDAIASAEDPKNIDALNLLVAQLDSGELSNLGRD